MRIAVTIISLLFAGCSAASLTEPEPPPADSDASAEGLVTIAYLKSLDSGRSTVIDKDILIEGRVVANDWLDEFYKTFTVADDSGGIEVELDLQRLYTVIPMHARIAISCNGLALGRVGGKITLGAPPSGDYPTDRIPSTETDRYFKIDCEDIEAPAPKQLTIAGLSAEHISQFVCIDNLAVIDAERGRAWCDTPKEDDGILSFTDRHFTDADGNMLTVRTLNRCDYATEPIPSGRIMLAGVVDYADGSYLLHIVNHYIFGSGI